jgi:predicted DNA-binding transcriptional regulator YafY
MPRSTHLQRAQRLNAAFNLLARRQSISDAADALMQQFGLSRRQAYRYLQQAQQMDRPVIIGEPSIPITIKVPADVVAQLRAFAATNDMTIGETVAHAVRAFLTKAGRHG